MSFIYPTSPVVGQDYIINGKSLRYNGIGFIPSPQTSDQAPDVLTEILPTDYIGGRRSVTGAEWTFETLRDNIFASGGASTVFVSTGSELESAFATEVEKINICVTKPISISGFPQSYPSQIYMTGCEVTITNSISFLSSLRISPPTLTTVYCDNVMNFTGFGDIDGNDRNAIVIMTNYRLIVRELRNPMNGEIIIPFQITSFGSYSLDIITGSSIAIDDVNSSGMYTTMVDDTLDLGQDDIKLDGSNVLDYGNTVGANDKMLVKKGANNFELVDVSAVASQTSGIAGTWEFSYDNGDVLVSGDASKSGRFGIKVAFKFKARAEAFVCNLFPNTNIGTWVRFEHADWCLNADNSGVLANLNQSFIVKGFFDSSSDLTQSGNYSNIAGAGTVSENQQDDGTRYLSSTQRIQRNDCTFTIGTNAGVSTADVWLLLHLSGTIL
jgi:hypothetical protein